MDQTPKGATNYNYYKRSTIKRTARKVPKRSRLTLAFQGLTGLGLVGLVCYHTCITKTAAAENTHFIQDNPNDWTTSLKPLKLLKEMLSSNNINCSTEASEDLNREIRNFLSEEAVVERTKNCSSYFEMIASVRSVANASKSEKEFPIAYSHSGKCNMLIILRFLIGVLV